MNCWLLTVAVLIAVNYSGPLETRKEVPSLTHTSLPHRKMQLTDIRRWDVALIFPVLCCCHLLRNRLAVCVRVSMLACITAETPYGGGDRLRCVGKETQIGKMIIGRQT